MQIEGRSAVKHLKRKMGKTYYVYWESRADVVGSDGMARKWENTPYNVLGV